MFRATPCFPSRSRLPTPQAHFFSQDTSHGQLNDAEGTGHVQFVHVDNRALSVGGLDENLLPEPILALLLITGLAVLAIGNVVNLDGYPRLWVGHFLGRHLAPSPLSAFLGAPVACLPSSWSRSLALAGLPQGKLFQR